MEYYAVNPALTTDIRGHPDGRPWRDDATAGVGRGDVYTNPWGGESTKIVGERPDLNLYDYQPPSNAAPDEYYQSPPTISLAFSGTVGQASGTVIGTNVWASLSNDEIRQRQQTNLTNQVQATRYSNCQTNLTPNWVVRIEQQDRDWYSEINQVLQDRMRDRVYDGDPKDYWPRDVDIRAINVNTNRYISTPVNESQWGQIMKDIGLHGYAIVDAANLVQTDIDNAVAADDRAALVGINVADPLYGWPPVYAPTVEPTGNGR